MSEVWKHLRPQDRYRIEISESVSFLHFKIVSQLYQPIIGMKAASLYMTLWSETEGEQLMSVDHNHQWLMNVTVTSLKEIYDARSKLEAIGLLKTYELEEMTESEYAHFLYKLNLPLSPVQFFNDDVLSICLYNQVGAKRYRQLRSRFAQYYSGFEAKESGREVTKEFHDVFTAVHPSELIVKQGSEQQEELLAMEKEMPFPVKQPDLTPPSFEQYSIDTDAIKGFFMKGIDSESILNEDNLTEIKKVAFFYQLDEWTLSRLIQDSLNIDEQLDTNLLRENAKQWYRLVFGGQPPQLMTKKAVPTLNVNQLQSNQGENASHHNDVKHDHNHTGTTSSNETKLSNTTQTNSIQPNLTQSSITPTNATPTNATPPNSDEQQHLAMLEQMSPLQLLSTYQGGGKVAEADVKLAEELIFEYKLHPSVVNLLIEYILLTNDFKLPKNLVTKVAAHWKRLNITDIRQAQELAKKEHLQYKEWNAQKQQKNKQISDQVNIKTNKKSTFNKVANQANVRKDKLPEWIAKKQTKDAPDKKDSQSTGAQSTSSPISDEQKQERIQSLLKALGEWEE